MDPDFLRYYNRELQFIREMGAEFARDFPKIAGRLGMDGFDCADPYVERLLEGFAFLAARVQLKLDAEFPSFTQHLLEMVYPHYLAPVPSMAVVQLQPDLTKGDLAKGFEIPRGTSLRSILGKGERTACEYRTASDVTLWPIELIEAKPLSTPAALAAGGQGIKGVKAGIRFRLRATGVPFNALPLDRLRLFLRGGDGLRMRLYEELLGHALAVVVRPGKSEPEWQTRLEPGSIRRVGFDDHEALLPYGPQSFQGYRLLQEYFAFPDRYLFVDFTGLGDSVKRCTESQLDIVVLLDQSGLLDEDAFDASYFALYCTPAINLFPKRADRVHLSNRGHEHHIIPDRTRPLDYEIFSIKEVVGIGAHTDPEQTFLPFYTSQDIMGGRAHRAYYSLHREPRVPSTQQQQRGPRSSYIGSEVFVSLVDADEAPYRHSLRQLAIGTLCTNRDLPLQLPLGKGNTDFSLEISAPVRSIRCVAGPTKPRPSFPKGDSAWRLISHLSLNYLSLSNQDAEQGANALRELLALYGDLGDAATRRQVDGVLSVQTSPITRRLPDPGRVTYARGLQVKLTMDPSAFEGSGVFLLGAVLEQFFAKYVSINSFTETVINTPDEGEVMRWPARIGRRQTS
ncbi:type VI secretion system baseplate subunit TssF [Thiorhodococcus mannitoliphagus]|uniref:Type VI secretion system baseplate subunit TssF n=1 Tax=Thiorhodococcus mannitoliphagus TaxID=329406 RepID=A0A6P1E2Z6_9GAMM|nr:type VI secretion system baseplate subunit TssF [Thiorhodococcus mannitoliphagus]NEX22394.1 type VI secretion system baseplate subunit TssF [Thiorhodococcus mannitoliphagus]